MTVYTPLGMLGYGFPIRSLQNALSHDLAAIAVDAGSTDPGPYYLGMGVSYTSRPMVRRDLGLLLEGARSKGIPLIVGSSGGAGGSPHLAWTRDIVLELAREKGIHCRVALIEAELDKEYVIDKIRQEQIVDFEMGRPLTEADVRRSTRVVAQMGAEPIIEALRAGADVVLAGRAYDPALVVAVPLMHGCDPGLAYHMGKILECGAIVATPRESDGVLGTITEDSFTVEPADPEKRCTVPLVAAHTLYEKADPTTLHAPGGVLRLDQTRFEQATPRTVRVTGSRFERNPAYYLKIEGAALTGYRALCIGGTRDPNMIKAMVEVKAYVRLKLKRDLSALEPDRDYRLLFHLYGQDAVMGSLEPERGAIGHELGIIIEVVAPTQDTADTVCALARSAMLHCGYPNRLANAGNLALRYTPADFPGPPVYEFSAYHLMRVENPVEPFTTTFIDT